LSYLNSLEGKKGFCYENYSPGGSFGRQYLTEQNAVRIDEIRDKIDEWFESERITESERYYLICALIEAIPFVSNISGTYGSYLKKWDKRAFKKIELNSPKLILGKSECFSFQRDANDLINDIECDVLYIDPPYNNRQYISNYHLLETISRNDKPILKGKTGIRDDSKELSSKYCKRQEAIIAFKDLLSKSIKRVGHVIISYNSEGIIPIDNIEDMLKKIGFVGVQRLEIPFTSSKVIRMESSHEKFKNIYLWVEDRLENIHL
jgi:adenine-specific DNA-methyltransferase